MSVLRAMGLGKVLRSKPVDVVVEDWSDIQDQAVSIVVLHLKPNVFKQVSKMATVEELFESLHEKYHKKELSNRLYTMLKLTNFRMAESTKIQDHVDAFNDLIMDLENLGEDLSDECKAIQLLSFLPASYQSLSRVLLHRDKQTITYNEVVTALLTDDMQQKLMLSSQPSSIQGASIALTVTRGRIPTKEQDKRKTKTRSRSKSRDCNTFQCWKCGKESHIKKDCRNKKSGESLANVAVFEDSRYALCTSSHVGNDKWILDSTCSYHMCHIKEFFSSYTPADGSVLMGNDQPYKIVRIGSVKIQMFNGQCVHIDQCAPHFLYV